MSSEYFYFQKNGGGRELVFILPPPSGVSPNIFNARFFSTGKETWGVLFLFPTQNSRTPKHLQVIHSNSRREERAAAPTTSASPSATPPPPYPPTPPLLAPLCLQREPRQPARPLSSSTAAALGGRKAEATTVAPKSCLSRRGEKSRRSRCPSPGRAPRRGALARGRANTQTPSRRPTRPGAHAHRHTHRCEGAAAGRRRRRPKGMTI